MLAVVASNGFGLLNPTGPSENVPEPEPVEVELHDDDIGNVVVPAFDDEACMPLMNFAIVTVTSGDVVAIALSLFVITHVLVAPFVTVTFPLESHAPLNVPVYVLEAASLTTYAPVGNVYTVPEAEPAAGDPAT
jgi:hypothetical protein